MRFFAVFIVNQEAPSLSNSSLLTLDSSFAIIN